ncbi:hypothetical protein L209DRAFT_56424 [Thermothelomyces heterothallicus CBS 203.75]
MEILPRGTGFYPPSLGDLTVVEVGIQGICEGPGRSIDQSMWSIIDREARRFPGNRTSRHSALGNAGVFVRCGAERPLGKQGWFWGNATLCSNRPRFGGPHTAIGEFRQKDAEATVTGVKGRTSRSSFNDDPSDGNPQYTCIY